MRETANAGDAGVRLLTAALVLMLLALLAGAIDLPVAQWLRQHPLPGELRRLVRLSEGFAWGGTVALIVLAAALLDGRRWRVVPRMTLHTAGAGVAAETVKLMVARLRPPAADLEGGVSATFVAWLPAVDPTALGQPYGYLLQSFPSGHAATGAGLAIALTLLYPQGRGLFTALAALAAVQRLQGDAHFLSDVLAGASLGALVGAACTLPGPLACWLLKVEGAADTDRGTGCF